MTAAAEGTTAIRAVVDVSAAPERAFEVFTNGFDSWWPRGHHLLGADLRRTGIEPRVGGEVWEESEAGETCVWGEVLTWEPPRQFVFSWRIGPDWAPPAPDAPASRVTVTFTATETGTRVELVHSDLDAHGDGWESVRDQIGAEGGWGKLLRMYADAV